MNVTMNQNSNINNHQIQQEQQNLLSNTYITYENLNKQKQQQQQQYVDEILLKEHREKQQVEWETQLKTSYEWQSGPYRQYQWLRRRRRRLSSLPEEYLDHELEDELWDELEQLEQKEEQVKQRKEQWEQQHLKLYLGVDDNEFKQDYNEQLKQIDYIEQMNEEEKDDGDSGSKQQDTLAKQLDDLEQYEPCQYAAQFEFVESFERFQQQQQQLNKPQSSDDDKLVAHDGNNKSMEENPPIFFQQKQQQPKINQLDWTLNTILKLIETYGTPLHIIVRQSIKENNIDDQEEEEDSDLEDYDTENEKSWITIVDNEDLFQQQQQQQQQRQQRRPLIYIQKRKYVRPIQRQLKSQHYLLLKVYINDNTFYLCKTSEMEQKVSEHMAYTAAYVLRYVYTYQGLQQVTTLVDNLHRNNSITIIQAEQMYVQQSKVQMNYLTFQPDIRQNNVRFQPIMICDLEPTINISRYLQRILQPLYDQVAESMTFYKDVDAIDAIELYAQRGHLRSDTLFVTIHIQNLCTIFPHEQTIQSLEQFLNIYLPKREIQGITIETIIQLVRVVLENQFFLYNNRTYQQIKGCGSGSPLTTLLADIYMFYWQQDLVNNLMNKNEIFGRCLDEIFFTWNGSIDEFLILLNNTIKKPEHHYHLASNLLTISIDKNVDYLDMEIGHINGHLQTKVKHNLRFEPYSFPSISNSFLSMDGNDDISTSSYSFIRETLIRAARACSNIIDFEHEQYFIHWSFDLNNDHYSLYKFHDIYLKMNRFFMEFTKQAFDSDQDNYEDFRRRVRQYDQNRIKMEIQRRKHEQEQQEIWYIVHPFKSNKLFNQFKQDFKRFWLRCCNYDDESYLNQQFNIKFIRRSNYPLKTKQR